MKFVFDLDDVIIKNSYVENDDLVFHWTRNIENDIAFKREDLKLIFSENWHQVIQGKETLTAHLDNVFKKREIQFNVKTFIAYWFEMDSVLDLEMVELIEQIIEHGHEAYIATNQEQTRISFLRNKYPELFQNIKQVYLSAEIGFAKPQKEFFEYVIKSLNCKPQEIVLIDDNSKNIKSAKQLGITGIIHKDLKYTMKALKELGIVLV